MKQKPGKQYLINLWIITIYVIKNILLFKYVLWIYKNRLLGEQTSYFTYYNSNNTNSECFQKSNPVCNNAINAR